MRGATHPGEPVRHGREGDAREVQREVDGVDERQRCTEGVPDHGHMVCAEPGDRSLHGGEHERRGPVVVQ